MRRKGESAIPNIRQPIPLNVGHPVGWYGLEVDDGAGSTVEFVDGTGTPNNESREVCVTVPRPRIEGGLVGVESFSTTVWHEAVELDLRLASVTGPRGGGRRGKAYCDGLRTSGNGPLREIYHTLIASVGNCEGNKGYDVTAAGGLFDVSIRQLKLSMLNLPFRPHRGALVQMLCLVVPRGG